MTLDQPTFLLVLPEFVMTPVVAVVGIVTLLAMAHVALRDAHTFEIDFLWLCYAALGVAVLITLGDGDLAGALAVAGLVGLTTAVLQACLPGRMGQGDIWLMGFIGLTAGPHYATPVLALLVLLSVLTSALYSRARGKKPFKSMFPMALPGMGAAILALSLRARDAMAGTGSALDGQLDIALVLILIGATLFMPWTGERVRMYPPSGGKPALINRDDSSRSRDRSRWLLRYMMRCDLRGCRLATGTVPDLVTVTLVDRDGSERPGPPWSLRDLVTLIQLLRAEVHPVEDITVDALPKRDGFVIDRRSALLPPGMTGLRCTYRRSPATDLHLELTVPRDEEVRPDATLTGPKAAGINR